MHELSLCEAIVDTVTRRAGDRPVRSVRVQIGYFRQVVPDALRFSWKMVTTGSALAGSAIEIDHVPATVACHGCGETSTLDMPVLACAPCGATDVELVSGEEFTLVSIELGAPDPQD